jgi:hypothetical protein
LAHSSSQEFKENDITVVSNVHKRISLSKKRRTVATKNKHVVMLLTEGCIEDIQNLLFNTVISGIENIVGYDREGNQLESSVHHELIHQGKVWGRHVMEPWTMLIAAAIYIVTTVGFGMPIFGLLADIIVYIARAAGALQDGGRLSFSPVRAYYLLPSQHWGWTVIAAVLQFGDAILYVYIGKIFTWLYRWLYGRPLWARMGKRTLVIVDNPTVHQLTENFVSKLFSQAYSFCTVDVHGASGLDHFVHRFTHRVVRGVLLAVGRPDGRICCLAKSESAILLSTKQAVFIRNPEYNGESSGPDVVTIGHNPFKPNLGVVKHITLAARTSNRRLFLDEYLYERTSRASKPFTGAILRSLSRQIDTHQQNRLQNGDMIMFPYGIHHIDPAFRENDSIDPLFSEFVEHIMHSKQLLRGDKADSTLSDDNKSLVSQHIDGKGCDPAARLAFYSKLDSKTVAMQNSQMIVQQFYESRIASLERYIAFCVLFHAMAKACNSPTFRIPWDMARSQSNLRIATTASPISAGDDIHEEISTSTKKTISKFMSRLHRMKINF